MPPELMGAALGATRRTANHDAFGLAVLVFHLLFMGRHPFAGRYLGKGEMQIERAIAECRYAYSRDARRTQMSPPPFVPPLANAGPAVADLFERAFAPDARTGGRPSPEAWVDALDALKAALVPCKSVPWHHHHPSTGACPWCAIEAPARIKLFGGLVRITTAVVADLETLWARYLAISEPGPPRALPVLNTLQRSGWPWPKPNSLRRSAQFVLRGLSHGRRAVGKGVARLRSWGTPLLIWMGAIIAIHAFPFLPDMVGPLSAFLSMSIALAHTLSSDPASAMLAVVLVCLSGPLLISLLGVVAEFFRWLDAASASHPARPRSGTTTPAANKISRRAAARAWKSAAAAWTAQPGPPDVSALRSPIEQVKQQLDALAAERDARIKACSAPEPEDAQRARYLGSFRIEDAKLPNIGPARCAVLRSWGIDTAADIEVAKIAEIPGFGKSLTDKLVIWREMREKAFVPTTNAIIDPLEVQKIDRQLATRRTKLMKELREKIAEVEARMKPFHDMRARLWADVEAAHVAMANG